jgi:hypothetical protein
MTVVPMRTAMAFVIGIGDALTVLRLKWMSMVFQFARIIV